MYVPGTQSFRLPIRIASYSIALVGFAVWWFKRGAHRNMPHPSKRWLLLAVLYLSLMLFHPLTNGLLAGVAQVMLYVAIFCAVFWAPAYVERPRQLVRILAILLVCNGINSVVGVLQVYDPDRWMPRELSFVYTTSRVAMEIATYIGPDGRASCGRRVCSTRRAPCAAPGPWPRCSASSSRSSPLPGGSGRRARVRARRHLGDLPEPRPRQHGGDRRDDGGLRRHLAHARRAQAPDRLRRAWRRAGRRRLDGLGRARRPSIQERFSTLLEDDPGSIYYSSRGQQLAAGFDDLVVEYPFGAGLARWGMMRGYFGDPSNLDSTALWAEVQPNAWILDGGVFLLGLYSAALLATVMFEWRLIRACSTATTGCGPPW